MAHPEQQAFVGNIKSRFPDYFKGKRVLEVGSQNINGSVRVFFKECDYIGIDCNPGKDVDVVCLAHDYVSMKLFDTVISCEAFEHDPFLDKTIMNIALLLKPGGLFVATAAAPGRQEHGTVRTVTPGYEAPHGPDPHYYKGVSVDYLQPLMSPHFDPMEVQLQRGGTDIYAFGFRK